MFNLEASSCFASNATVRLVSGHLKRMSDLAIGDQVYVKREDVVVSSAVLTVFRHYRHLIHFIDIYTTESNVSLRLTPTHSLLVLSQDRTTMSYSFARDVRVGEFVFTSDLRLLKVIDIKEISFSKDYVYAPLTFEGTIIVNDIIASCYGTYAHSTMHMVTLLIRWWYYILLQIRQMIQYEQLQTFTNNLIVFFLDSI